MSICNRLTSRLAALPTYSRKTRLEDSSLSDCRQSYGVRE